MGNCTEAFYVITQIKTFFEIFNFINLFYFYPDPFCVAGKFRRIHAFDRGDTI